MRILLLGADGQVGWELRRALAPLGELTALGRTPRDGLQGDLADAPALAASVRRLAPAVIVNAAAHTAVDQAEREPALAEAVNAVAPGVLAREAAALGAWLVHYGTDYVFDGSGTHARTEAAAVAPLSVYGRTKLAGEQAIQASGCRHLILRTSWVHAARGGNFMRTMLRLAAERDHLDVVADQVGAPTGAELLADLTAQILPRVQARPELGGLYHAAAAGSTSRLDWVRHALAWGRAHGLALRCGPDALRPVATAAFPTPAVRPLNSRLDCRRLGAAFGLVLPPWEDGVERVLAELYL